MNVEKTAIRTRLFWRVAKFSLGVKKYHLRILRREANLNGEIVDEDDESDSDGDGDGENDGDEEDGSDDENGSDEEDDDEEEDDNNEEDDNEGVDIEDDDNEGDENGSDVRGTKRLLLPLQLKWGTLFWDCTSSKGAVEKMMTCEVGDSTQPRPEFWEVGSCNNMDRCAELCGQCDECLVGWNSEPKRLVRVWTLMNDEDAVKTIASRLPRPFEDFPADERGN